MCGHIPVTKALRLLIPKLPYNEIQALIDELPRQRVEKPEHTGKLILPYGVKPLRPEHKQYLRRRGFKWRRIRKLWKVRGIGTAPSLAWRIFIPVYYHGEMVSWTTRTISSDPDILRYRSAAMNEEAIPHKDLLYGEDYARHAIIVVEGPTDAWRIGPGAVATFGTDWTMAQARKMIKYPIRAICFDSEPEAQKQAKKLYRILNGYPGQTLRIELDAKDPGDAAKEEIRELRERILR